MLLQTRARRPFGRRQRRPPTRTPRRPDSPRARRHVAVRHPRREGAVVATTAAAAAEGEKAARAAARPPRPPPPPPPSRAPRRRCIRCGVWRENAGSATTSPSRSARAAFRLQRACWRRTRRTRRQEARRRRALRGACRSVPRRRQARRLPQGTPHARHGRRVRAAGQVPADPAEPPPGPVQERHHAAPPRARATCSRRLLLRPAAEPPVSAAPPAAVSLDDGGFAPRRRCYRGSRGSDSSMQSAMVRREVAAAVYALGCDAPDLMLEGDGDPQTCPRARRASPSGPASSVRDVVSRGGQGATREYFELTHAMVARVLRDAAGRAYRRLPAVGGARAASSAWAKRWRSSRSLTASPIEKRDARGRAAHHEHADRHHSCGSRSRVPRRAARVSLLPWWWHCKQDHASFGGSQRRRQQYQRRRRARVVASTSAAPRPGRMSSTRRTARALRQSSRTSCARPGDAAAGAELERLVASKHVAGAGGTRPAAGGRRFSVLGSRRRSARPRPCLRPPGPAPWRRRSRLRSLGGCVQS